MASAAILPMQRRGAPETRSLEARLTDHDYRCFIDHDYRCFIDLALKRGQTPGAMARDLVLAAIDGRSAPPTHAALLAAEATIARLENRLRDSDTEAARARAEIEMLQHDIAALRARPKPQEQRPARILSAKAVGHELARECARLQKRLDKERIERGQQVKELMQRAQAAEKLADLRDHAQRETLQEIRRLSTANRQLHTLMQEMKNSRLRAAEIAADERLAVEAAALRRLAAEIGSKLSHLARRAGSIADNPSGTETDHDGPS